MVREKIKQPQVSLRTLAAGFKTRYWNSPKEYWHMTLNNVVLLSVWALMCWAVGAALFFTIYVICVSLAGGAGIMLFTVQHNFEHAYAADTQRWDYDMAAIAGTTFLVLPWWLNWFTANIGYHHVHHLSAKIPNYCLAKCHNDNVALFTAVKRITLTQIPASLRCLLWDSEAQRIISFAEYRRR